MDVKTESKILLTALAAAPAAAGLILVINDEAVAYGVLLMILGFGIMIWLWKPWKWFQKKDNNKKT